MIVYLTDNGVIATDSGTSLDIAPYHSILTDGSDLAVARARKKLETKWVAGEKIIKMIPEWKQRNFIARAVELLRKEVKATATGEEITELDSLEALMTGGTRPIRTASDSIEAEIEALTTVEEANAYGIYGNPLWP